MKQRGRKSVKVRTWGSNKEKKNEKKKKLFL
jgi:hypothetical protein